MGKGKKLKGSKNKVVEDKVSIKQETPPPDDENSHSPGTIQLFSV
jgi:hypothetical protein